MSLVRHLEPNKLTSITRIAVFSSQKTRLALSVRRPFTLHYTASYPKTRHIQSLLSMSANEIDHKKHAKDAAELIIKAPILKVPQAMRAADFTNEESYNPTLQQRVRRIYHSMLEQTKSNQPATNNVLLNPNPLPVSGITTTSTPHRNSTSSDSASGTEIIPIDQTSPPR